MKRAVLTEDIDGGYTLRLKQCYCHNPFSSQSLNTAKHPAFQRLLLAMFQITEVIKKVAFDGQDCKKID